ncbi:hypothetical protein CVT26_009545 [Gymnopilus dilepis]|uniref:Methyltransferase type 11 domain-containing protein n=1 Tax=Gymnopilus dilepis TaxID=231916 RepID=A0A409VKF6_9AGAR|nr:hypothetical protein CVT26_009545 [Gymnopilus dilepis]
MRTQIRTLSNVLCRTRHVRAFAAVSSNSPPPSMNTVGPYEVFDRKVKRMQRERAALREGGARSRTVDYVREEVANRMMERFLDIKRDFNAILDLGSGPGHLSKLLEKDKVQKSIMFDSSGNVDDSWCYLYLSMNSVATLYRDPDSDFEVEVERIHGDEENSLAYVEPNSQEAILSCALVQIQKALKPDGLFLGAMFGGDTLFELRTSLQLAEVEREGGISPHVSPMTDTRDISNLLGRAGFNMLTVDIDEVKVAYPSMWELMEDLQDMGENNAVIGRRNYLHRDTLAAASAIYKELHGSSDSVPATFQIIYMIGWKPDPSQRKPLERGSGQVNLKDVL